jgi:hypothetical protein
MQTLKWMSKSSPESDTLQVVATLRQREEGNEHPGLHLSHPLLFIVLAAAAGRRLIFAPLIAGEEVGARAHRRRGIAAEHRAAAAQPRSRRRGAAGAAVRVVEALRPRGCLRVCERATVVVPPRRRRLRADAGLAVPISTRRLQRHVLDLKTQEIIS